MLKHLQFIMFAQNCSICCWQAGWNTGSVLEAWETKADWTFLFFIGLSIMTSSCSRSITSVGFGPLDQMVVVSLIALTIGWFQNYAAVSKMKLLYFDLRIQFLWLGSLICCMVSNVLSCSHRSRIYIRRSIDTYDLASVTTTSLIVITISRPEFSASLTFSSCSPLNRLSYSSCCSYSHSIMHTLSIGRMKARVQCFQSWLNVGMIQSFFC